VTIVDKFVQTIRFNNRPDEDVEYDRVVLMEKLSDNISKNEVAAREAQQSLSKVEIEEAALIKSIKDELLVSPHKEDALRRIKVLRMRTEGLLNKLRILNKNIDDFSQQHSKLELLGIAQLRGTDPDYTSELQLEYEESAKDFQDSTKDLEGLLAKDLSAPFKQDPELKKLEAEILGSKGP